MLDPRLYRTGFIAVAMALIVVAFSLVDQPGPLSSNLAPDAFNGATAFAQMSSLARANPDRRPGSPGDDDVASVVASKLRGDGFTVSQDTFTARTVDGRRTLENVVATRPGLTAGTIVVVSHRDSLDSPGTADLSGTAGMLELARALAGQHVQHTIVMASVSGSAGGAGTERLAQTLPGPIDAVISLGDLAATHAHGAAVVPWSLGPEVAPPVLRNTVASALTAEAGLHAGNFGLAGQLGRLAVPMTLGEQAPFGARRIPAVTLSLISDARSTPGEPISPDRLTAAGRAVLSSVNALDAGPRIPAAKPYLVLSGKVIPAWAVQLLVLALLVPVLLTATDGLARARRRGHAVSAGILRGFSAAVPFLLVGLLAVLTRVLGWVDAPPGPVGPGEVPLHGAGVVLVVVIGLVLVIGLPLWGWLQFRRRGRQGADPAQAIATLLLLGLVTFALGIVNPFDALLAVPAVHLWMWLLDGDLRPHPVVGLVFILGGLVAPALIAVDYAHALGLGISDVPWNGLLLVAGGAIGPVLVALWCVLAGCTLGVVTLTAQKLLGPAPEDGPVTVRGPVTYAGPGSLGGTESALRVRR